MPNALMEVLQPCIFTKEEIPNVLLSSLSEEDFVQGQLLNMFSKTVIKDQKQTRVVAKIYLLKHLLEDIYQQIQLKVNVQLGQKL